MKRFVKGNIETIVDDDDRRIKEYIANGWTEAPLIPKQLDDKDKLRDEAIKDTKTKKRGGASDKKVNDTIKAKMSADADAGVVDDGLFKKEGK